MKQNSQEGTLGMFLDVTPGALAAASAQVAALTGRLMAANTVHTAAIAAIMPPGSDIPSVKVSETLRAKGLTHEAMAMMGNTQLAGSSMGVGESSASYEVGEVDGVAVYTASAGL